MTNRDLEATWTYHNETKHSFESLRANPHRLDWPNRPVSFKNYTTLEPIPLPSDSVSSETPALTVISSADAAPSDGSLPDLRTIAQLLFLSAGVTRRRAYQGGELLFRAASCTGALYHIDLYLICAELPGLEAGVYHFDPQDFALRRLRRGDFRGAVIDATGDEPAIAAAPAIIACASTYWRNTWKYQARTYRHCFWDNGTILANLLAAAGAYDTPARIVGGFVDRTVSRLLDLDDKREGVVSLVALGRAPSLSPGPPPAVEPLDLQVAALSPTEVDYPAIRAMHGASSLSSEAEAASWRAGTPALELPDPSGRLFPLAALAEAEEPSDTIEQVIVRRGSTREFDPQASISFAQLSTMLQSATRGISADFLEPPDAMLNRLYLIVNNVDELPPGAYVYHRKRAALELLKAGSFRSDAAHLGLEQALPGAASVDVFFLTDLERVLECFGNRGYRAAQLEAGVIGGKLYLAAYAQRLGATGLTFYDDDVTAFFSPHAEGHSVMFLVALGKSVRRRR